MPRSGPLCPPRCCAARGPRLPAGPSPWGGQPGPCCGRALDLAARLRVCPRGSQERVCGPLPGFPGCVTCRSVPAAEPPRGRVRGLWLLRGSGRPGGGCVQAGGRGKAQRESPTEKQGEPRPPGKEARVEGHETTLRDPRRKPSQGPAEGGPGGETAQKRGPGDRPGPGREATAGGSVRARLGRKVPQAGPPPPRAALAPSGPPPRTPFRGGGGASPGRAGPPPRRVRAPQRSGPGRLWVRGAERAVRTEGTRAGGRPRRSRPQPEGRWAQRGALRAGEKGAERRGAERPEGRAGQLGTGPDSRPSASHAGDLPPARASGDAGACRPGARGGTPGRGRGGSGHRGSVTVRAPESGTQQSHVGSCGPRTPRFPEPHGRQRPGSPTPEYVPPPSLPHQGLG